MRKLVCTILVLAGAVLSTSAQHYLGVKGGYGSARGRIQTVWGQAQSETMWGKYTAGAVWRYFSPQAAWGGVALEMEYQQRGYRMFDSGTTGQISAIISDTTSYRAKTRTASAITMPLVWHPHLYLMKRRVRLYASLGVTFTYNLGAGDTHTYTKYTARKEEVEVLPGKFRSQWTQTVAEESAPYKMQTARDVRWNYGWLGGVGVSVFMGRWEAFAEGRYYYGMSDILRTDSKYRFNEERTMRSELDNIFVTVGVAFRLGKGGILAPPLRKRVAPPPGDSDFRNIKLSF